MHKRISLRLLLVFYCIGGSMASFSQSATILVNGYPIANGDTLAICSSATQSFDVNTTGVGSTVTYSWSFQNGTPNTSTLKTPYSAFNVIGFNNIHVFAYGNDTASAQIVIQILPPVIAGVVSGAQSFCLGTLPNALSRTNASGGNGVFTYEWQYSVGNTMNWVNSGESGLTFLPSFSITADTWFRVKVLTACGTFYTSPVKLWLLPPVTAGYVIVSAFTSMICVGDDADLFLQSNAGGNGNYVVTWEKRLVGTANWQPANLGNFLITYTDSNLTASTDYRAIVSSCGQADTTNTVTVLVAPPVVLGPLQTIGSTTICASTAPDKIYVNHTGGGANVSIWWYRKAVGSTSWFFLSTGDTLFSYSGLSQNTQYRAVAKSFVWGGYYCDDVYSDTLLITVLPPINGVSGISTNQNICFGAQPALLTKTPVSGVGNNFSLEWQDSTLGVYGWQNTGVSTLTYQPSPLTTSHWYRVRVSVLTCGQVFYSNAVHVNVYPQFIPGVLQPDSTYLCAGGSVQLSVANTSGGTGTITRQWQYKPAAASTWANIPGVSTNATSYTAQNLQQSFSYRVIISSGCSSNDTSNTAYVNIASAVSAGHIVTSTGYANTCLGMPAPPLQLVGYGGGRGPYSFAWQKQIGNGAWFSVGNNTDSLTDLIPLTQNTTYRVVVSDQGGCGTATSDTLQIKLSDLYALNDSIIGPSEVCNGSNGIYYRIVPGYADSVYWQFTNGTIINNGIDRVFINAGNFSPLNSDTLFATLFDVQIGCERTLKFPIKLNGNIAPQSGAITLKPNSTELVYSDSLTGYQFSWGNIERSSGYENIYSNSNSNRFSFAVLDTNTFIYFVKVTNTVCENVVYYNASGSPFSVLEENLHRQFALYPNPNFGVIHLMGPITEVVELQIFGVNGIQIPIKLNQLKTEISLPESMPAGFYTLVLTTSKGIKTLPFILISK